MGRGGRPLTRCGRLFAWLDRCEIRLDLALETIKANGWENYLLFALFVPPIVVTVVVLGDFIIVSGQHCGRGEETTCPFLHHDYFPRNSIDPHDDAGMQRDNGREEHPSGVDGWSQWTSKSPTFVPSTMCPLDRVEPVWIIDEATKMKNKAGDDMVYEMLLRWIPGQPRVILLDPTWSIPSKAYKLQETMTELRAELDELWRRWEEERCRRQGGDTRDPDLRRMFCSPSTPATVVVYQHSDWLPTLESFKWYWKKNNLPELSGKYASHLIISDQFNNVTILQDYAHEFGAKCVAEIAARKFGWSSAWRGGTKEDEGCGTADDLAREKQSIIKSSSAADVRAKQRGNAPTSHVRMM